MNQAGNLRHPKADNLMNPPYIDMFERVHVWQRTKAVGTSSSHIVEPKNS
jgi:hypothetical protein